MIHKLKTWPNYFNAVARGDKQFELRFNDREFSHDDELLLEEYVPDKYYGESTNAHYTGRILHRRVVYILEGGQFGLEEGYVLMGLKNI
jgi:hypothetical protein